MKFGPNLKFELHEEESIARVVLMKMYKIFEKNLIKEMNDDDGFRTTNPTSTTTTTVTTTTTANAGATTDKGTKRKAGDVGLDVGVTQQSGGVGGGGGGKSSKVARVEPWWEKEVR